MSDLERQLDLLWDISHGKADGNPNQAFIEYCTLLINAYRSKDMSSEDAAYKICGEFNPEVTFTETEETEAIMDKACNLELGDSSHYYGKEEVQWQEIEELLKQYKQKQM